MHWAITSKLSFVKTLLNETKISWWSASHCTRVPVCRITSNNDTSQLRSNMFTNLKSWIIVVLYPTAAIRYQKDYEKNEVDTRSLSWGALAMDALQVEDFDKNWPWTRMVRMNTKKEHRGSDLQWLATNWLSVDTFFSSPLCWYVCKQWVIEISELTNICDNGSKDRDKVFHTSVYKALEKTALGNVR